MPTPTPTLASTLASLYDYDATEPLAVETHAVDTVEAAAAPTVKLHDQSYAGKSGRVSAYLAVPDGTGPFPAVLFVHPTGSTREYYRSEALRFARAGAIGLLITTAYAPPFPPQFSIDEQDRSAAITTVVDLRRGLDLLAARPEVDMGRVGHMGVSVGGTAGATLAAVDKRVAAFTLLSAVPRSSDWTSFDRSAKVAKLKEAGTLDAYLTMMDPVEPINYVAFAAPARLLFQFGKLDSITPAPAAEALYAAASQPKELRWYDDGHSLNGAAARSERRAWLGEQLGITVED